MSVFGSIFGKNGFGKGSPRSPALRGATLEKIWQKIASPVTGLCSGRSVWRTFIPTARHARTFSARPETEHNIGGAPAHTLTSRRYQSGRTLLEMLAVLAIVGILSVAALAGLMWALAKYRANDTIHDVHIWQLAALDSNQLFDRASGQLILPELGSVSTHGYPMAVWIQDKDVFTVHVNDVPKRVCSLMLDMIDENQTLTVNDVRFNNNDICTNDTNALVFYMNKDMGNVGSICIPSCEEGETCCGGECRTIQTPCGTDGCTDCGGDYCTTSNTCCPTPTATKCGDTDCCDTKCCNGVCCPESYMTCDATTTCGCPNNMVPDADTGACKCPDDAPYFFEEAGICCKSGYTPVDGACQKIDCRGGPTSYNCYINDKFCGYNCDSIGRNCLYGICYADSCPSGTSFEEFIHEGRYAGGYRFGCHIPNSFCYYNRKASNSVLCFMEDGSSDRPCCSADPVSLECTRYACDKNICPENGTFFISSGDYAFCRYNGFYCTPFAYTNGEPSIWRCWKESLNTVCDTACLSPPDCDEACFDTNPCPDGTTYDGGRGLCCQGDVCCDYEGTGICYKGETVCGTGCKAETQQCNDGCCTDPNCPNGFSYSPVSVSKGNFWGCSNGVMACIYNSSTSAICYYNGVPCGSGCDYDGTNCERVSLPECAPIDEETGKRHCVYGRPVSETCVCDTDKTLTVGALCCAEGQQDVNGTCAVVSN